MDTARWVLQEQVRGRGRGQAVARGRAWALGAGHLVHGRTLAQRCMRAVLVLVLQLQLLQEGSWLG